MRTHNGITLESSLLHKSLFGLTKAITSPRSSLSWVLRGHLAKDEVFVSQTYWFTGALPRVALKKVLPGIENVEIRVPRAFDRKGGTSINAEEASHLAAIARFADSRSALEIGTYDGNTALLLAANIASDGRVVTVDLPPDFTVEQQNTLTYTDVELNLTPRRDLGRQYEGHALAPKINQIYGDSAKVDWKTFQGPFDLIFIDGCHSTDYVRADSENALKQLGPGGILLWHDYGMIPDVSSVVDALAHEHPEVSMYALEGTRLAIGLTK